jgi:hypothetical protein
MLAPYHDRVLDPVFALGASKVLLQKQIPPVLPTPLANACRSAAHQVLDLLQIPIDATQGVPEHPMPSSMSAAAPI